MAAITVTYKSTQAAVFLCMFLYTYYKTVKQKWQAFFCFYHLSYSSFHDVSTFLVIPSVVSSFQKFTSMVSSAHFLLFEVENSEQ